MRSPFLIPMLGLLVAGCASKPVVTNISASTGVLAGVPFRIKTEQVVHVFKRNEKGEYDEVSRAQDVFADFSRLYALDVHSGPFASPSLTVAQNPDNTLKSAQIAGTDQTAATLDAATSAVTGVTKLQNDADAARLTSAQAVLTADKAVRDAQDALSNLPSTASTATRSIYEQTLQSAREAAQIARVNAGMPALP